MPDAEAGRARDDMGVIRRLGRGLVRGAPWGIATVTWFALGALGWSRFFDGGSEPTILLFAYLVVFGVGVWFPYLTFLFRVAEEVVTTEPPRSPSQGAMAGLLVALFGLAPIVAFTTESTLQGVFAIAGAAAVTTLLGINRADRSAGEGRGP